jgi:uncharacterized DUF497 family protein
MDVVHHLNGIKFVWDRAKAQVNVQKHGISLELACEVFFDPFIRLLRAEWSGGEEREVAIGLTKDWTLLVVVYTLREESIRMISARSATGPERKAYEDE